MKSLADYFMTVGNSGLIVCTVDKVTKLFKNALPNTCFFKKPCSSTVSSLCRNSCLNFHQVLASLWFRKKKKSLVAGDMS